MSYYNRKGIQVSLLEWAKLNHCVAVNRTGDVFVSTILLGPAVHLSITERPMIFETMVFREGEDGEREIIDEDRYPSEDEALFGHRSMCERYGVAT